MIYLCSLLGMYCNPIFFYRHFFSFCGIFSMVEIRIIEIHFSTLYFINLNIYTMTRFQDLTPSQQMTASLKYIFDEEDANLFFDEYLSPYIQTAHGRLYCTLKAESTFDKFHNYSNKQN